jgi:hypothetical protein
MYSIVRLSDGRTETASCVWLCEVLSVGYTIFMEVVWLCELLQRERQVIVYTTIQYFRVDQITDARSPWRLKFVLWRLISVGL